MSLDNSSLPSGRTSAYSEISRLNLDSANLPRYLSSVETSTSQYFHNLKWLIVLEAFSNMESLGEEDWDVVIAGTSLSQSLLALCV